MTAADIISLVNPATAAGKFAVKYAVKAYLEKRAKDKVAQEIAQKEADDLAKQLLKEMDEAVEVAKSCSNSFPLQTAILMRDGRVSPIGSIGEGDAVQVEDAGRRGVGSVIRVIETNRTQSLVSIRLEDGATLDATAEHPVWEEGGRRFIPARLLRTGDLLRNSAGDLVRVYSVHARTETLPVRNLEVVPGNTFYAGSSQVLVHNCNRLTTKQATQLAEYLGATPTNFTSALDEKIFKYGKYYITQDRTSHKGGVWKMAKSVKDLQSTSSVNRMGTYSWDLQPIAK